MSGDLRRLRAVVKGVGSALPKRCVTNKELESSVDTSDEWIVQRTGIMQRYIAGEDETTSTLGIAAGRVALESAGLTPDDIDLVICATSTPDYTFPSTATMIQAGLGITRGVAFDLQAVCAGFVFAVSTAEKFLVSGSHKRALVIGAETFSRILDWEDRTTCVLFGDGAGAIVLEAQEDGARRGAAWRAGVAPALRRPASRQALRRWRPVHDQDRRLPAHGRQGSVPLRGGTGHGRDGRNLFRLRAFPPRISTGSCRTRPTAGSSTPLRKNSAFPPKRW